MSLDNQDVAFLDSYAREHHCPSRSAALAQAIRALRESTLVDAYTNAFREFAESGELDAWDAATSDGMNGE